MTRFLQTHYYEILFAAIFGGIFIFYILEAFIPRRKSFNNQTSRWVNNIILAFANHQLLLIFMLGMGYVAYKFQPGTTLVRHFQLSDIGALVFLILLADFISYWLHRAFHTIPFLWRLHAVHHTDTEVDVTTSQRLHPFEIIMTNIIATPIFMLIGAPMIAFIYFNLLHTFISLYAHSNIVLPERLDNVLRKLIVTPDFHRMHHSSDRQYTDSNFSVMFPFFDYVFGTATRLPYEELPAMELGLETLRESKDNRIDQLLLTPFNLKKGIDNN